MWLVRFFSGTLIFCGIVSFAYNIMATAIGARGAVAEGGELCSVKPINSATFAVAAALVLFFIGGLLTTVVPPLVDKSWGRPFENHDPSKGPTGKLQAVTRRRN